MGGRLRAGYCGTRRRIGVSAPGGKNDDYDSSGLARHSAAQCASGVALQPELGLRPERIAGVLAGRLLAGGHPETVLAVGDGPLEGTAPRRTVVGVEAIWTNPYLAGRSLSRARAQALLR